MTVVASKEPVATGSVAVVMKRLQTATSFVQIFGKFVDDKKLKKQFHDLARVVHPDHNEHQFKAASAVWLMLKSFHEAAQDALKDRTYEREFSPGDFTKTAVAYPETILQSKIATYRLESSVFRDGDFSALYKAKIDKTKETVLVKISALPEHNSLLEHEAQILKKFATEKKLENIKKFVPTLLDSFVLPDKERRRFRVNVMPFHDGYYSLTEIKKFFPTGLDPRDAAWICRRVISQVVAAHMAGVVHGALTPDHVLVHPVSHDPIHIGWVHAVNQATGFQRITMLVERWRDWFPPEVFAKELPDQATDIFMTGKTMIYLLGGDIKKNTFPKSVPTEMQRVILQCVDPQRGKRPQSGADLLLSFTDMLLKLWGRKYRKLEIPNR